jgi:uncharacterized membrane protein
MLNSVQISNSSDANATGQVPAGGGWRAGVLACAAAAWAVAVPVTPVAAAAWPLGAAVLYAVGALVCHQEPARSFHVEGHQWLVCARCSGLYLGAAAGALGSWGVVRWRPRFVGSRRMAVRGLSMAAMPTLVTVVSAGLGLGDPSNAWRAGLAVPLGLVAGAVAVALAAERVK